MIRITFIGDFAYNYGSGQTVLQYFNFSKKHNLSISISGYVDKVLKSRIPTIDKVNRQNTDVAIFVFENIMYLDAIKYPERLGFYLKNTKRENRLVIDTDGKYGVLKSKTNSFLKNEQVWDYTIDQLTDIVLQPSFKIQSKKSKSFLFFGFPEIERKIYNKRFDILYIGNNWFREKEMVIFLRESNKSRRVKRVKIIGRGWDKNKLYTKLNYKDSRRPVLEINIDQPVLPERLIKTMSIGVINPILVNKILLKRKIVTPRMFETFAADTIPLFFSDLDYYQFIYSEVGKNFLVSINEVKDRVKDVFKNVKKYVKQRDLVRNYLVSNHSYERRITELKSIILSI